MDDSLSSRPARCRSFWCQVVKDLFIGERLGAPLLIVQSSDHAAALHLGVGIQSGKRGESVWFNKEQLMIAENNAAVSADGARAFFKLVAAARNERFGAKPGSVAVRRRRSMNCYFHSSTVFRIRR
jgi:hypothetical protein